VFQSMRVNSEPAPGWCWFERLSAARCDVDIDSVIDALVASIHYRILVPAQPVTRRFTDNIFSVLAQIGRIAHVRVVLIPA
jgi:hypothetical protein